MRLVEELEVCVDSSKPGSGQVCGPATETLEIWGDRGEVIIDGWKGFYLRPTGLAPEDYYKRKVALSCGYRSA
jgi:hypothetical protein